MVQFCDCSCTIETKRVGGLSYEVEGSGRVVSSSSERSQGSIQCQIGTIRIISLESAIDAHSYRFTIITVKGKPEANLNLISVIVI